MSGRVTVLIVDDHPLFRQGLRAAVAADDRLELAGEAGDGASALQQIRERKPDVALLDINLPQMSGLDVAREVQRRGLETRLVILTMHREEETFNRAMDLGVTGFVLKDSAAQDVVASILAAGAGQHYLSPAISGYLVRRLGRSERLAARKPGMESLTRAERRILKLVAAKKTSPQIAKELFISPRTVEAHRANISSKLQLRGSHSLLHFALENRDAL